MNTQNPGRMTVRLCPRPAAFPLVLAAVLAGGLGFAATAQEAVPGGGAAPGATPGPALEAAPADPGLPADGGAPASPQTPAGPGTAPPPAAPDGPDAEGQPAAPAGAETASDTPAVGQPGADAQDTAFPEDLPAAAAEPAPEPVPPPAPFPSPLKDPMGAIAWILDRPATQPGQGHDLSPLGMFRAADIVVKVVMLGLVFASLVTWTVWVAKTLEIWAARRRLKRSLRAIHEARSLDAVMATEGRRAGPAAEMIRAADAESRRSDEAVDHAGGDGLERRVASALAQIELAAGRRISRGTGVLATIGSTAPFVGLFGTVWGIMNSFVSIAESNTTNLAVVAPGIAEALLATAIGLVAAIPAVIVYNLFARSITGWRQQLGAAAAGIERLVSRDLDFRRVPAYGLPLPLATSAGPVPEGRG